MSVDNLALLRKQLAAGEHEQAGVTARNVQSASGVDFAEIVGAVHHAINARQALVVLLLLEAAKRFCAAGEGAALIVRLDSLSLVIAACRREKMAGTAGGVRVSAFGGGAKLRGTFCRQRWQLCLASP